MPGAKSRKKDLYLGKSLSDLNKFAEVKELGPNVNVIIKSADKLYKEASKHDDLADEERSYVLFMKYFNVISQAKRKPDYKKQKEYYDSLIGNRNQLHAIERAEKLSKSLNDRYDLIEAESVAKKLEALDIKSKNKQTDKEKDKKEPVEVEKGESENGSVSQEKKTEVVNSIKPTGLYNLIKDKTSQILIIDVRTISEYKESHLDNKYCINVPIDIVPPGTTCNRIEKELSEEYKSLWLQRGNVDHIILLDWNSTLSTTTVGTTLNTLKDALFKYDSKFILKSEPLILEGGYSQWLLYYPMLTTNPHINRPQPTVKEPLALFVNQNNLYPSVSSDLKPSGIKNTNIAQSPKSQIPSNSASNSVKTLPSDNLPEETDSKNSQSVKQLEEELKKIENLEKIRKKQEKDVADLMRMKRNLQEDLKKEKSNQDEMRIKEKEEEELRKKEIERLEQELQDKQEEENLQQEREKQRKLDQIKQQQKEAEEERRRQEEQRQKEEREQIAQERQRAENERLAQERLRAEKERLSQEKVKAENERLAQEKVKAENERVVYATPGLPVGWEKRLDRNTNRYYYIDHNKGQTHWEPPNSTPTKAKLKEEPTTPSSSSSGLKRSFSSPDIMKLMAEEQQQKQQPSVNRSVKPSPRIEPKTYIKAPVKRRDLNPVYGNVGAALTGLRNLGNTCFMNSTIQCLNHTTPLVTYFLNDYYERDINRSSFLGMNGEVVDEFAVVTKALWSGQYRCITPRDLKSTIGKYNPMFAGYEQQDSQEFLTFLLDGLHEGLNEVKRRPQIPDQNNDNIPDREAAELAWANHKKVNSSVIVSLFQGQLKSTVQCRTCGKQSVTFEAFMYLSLPIPDKSRCTLKDCIQTFLRPEMMTGSSRYKCSVCKVPRDAVKRIELWKLPAILLIGLNRFVSDGMWMQKKTNYVDYAVTDLNLSGYIAGPVSKTYNLYAVSNHYGTMEGGHYTAYCQNPSSRKWYKFDDHEVYDISSSDVKSSAGYLLFYTSMKLPVPEYKPQF
ncbi:hypothetical protein LOTGIDRAFT_215305 [Lottia gigantea]|uniref:ubiquitinyl hydrolase 1 n=1 Tax=Lottia gigantea TaxID=225164 RepID=V4AE39_LOTGI|nr:hypothetical protein LOTGIDRAFT_215305 [Lottia gigantea]ESO95142.1 hypothetical protein LOTGIDRAFT_215305 [Lottia gigantea]